jgi:hypothetical protein
MTAFVQLAHILVFSTFLGYVGIWKDKIPAFMYTVILTFGIVIILYHIVKAFYKKDPWVNLIHILVVGPILVYIGLMKKETPYKAFEIVLMLAFASLGYHGYYLLKGF